MEFAAKHKRMLAIPVIFMIPMMIIILFSQIAMEIYAYNFAVGKNMEIMNVYYLEKYISDNKTTDEQKIENVTEETQETTEGSSVISFIMPVKAGVTTSEFGDKDSRNTAHQGHDWAVSSGTEVVAVADGIVEKAYYSESYGYNVLISHGEGTETRYAHLSALSVSTGEKVKQNQTIGLSGSTGDSTGPHLHFEVVNNGTRVNPMPYFK
jgi:murein DD-endopeptidase MepM/ murein hydrolase activator NlpD